MSKKDKIFNKKCESFFLIDFAEIQRNKIEEIIKFTMRKGRVDVHPYNNTKWSYDLNLTNVKNPGTELTGIYKGEENNKGKEFNLEKMKIIHRIVHELKYQGLVVCSSDNTKYAITNIQVICEPAVGVDDNELCKSTKCSLRFIAYKVIDKMSSEYDAPDYELPSEPTYISYTAPNELTYIYDDVIKLKFETLDTVYDYVMKHKYDNSIAWKSAAYYSNR